MNGIKMFWFFVCLTDFYVIICDSLSNYRISVDDETYRSNFIRDNFSRYSFHVHTNVKIISENIRRRSEQTLLQLFELL